MKKLFGLFQVQERTMSTLISTEYNKKIRIIYLQKDKKVIHVNLTKLL
jgi:hypothetical protein